jgi:predicted DNA binding protein
MKYVRVRASPDLDAAPGFFRLVAASPHVAEARLIDWNVAGDGPAIVLFEVAGGREAFAERLADLPEIRDADLTAVATDRFYALVEVSVAAAALLREMLDTVTTEGVVVVKPVVYRDAGVEAQLVGDADALQATLDGVPGPVSVDVREIGAFDRSRRAPLAALSDRQREAVLAAADLGYYEQPRRATHRDVADALGCAPSTATEHLQKAERKLVEQAVATASEPGWR